MPAELYFRNHMVHLNFIYKLISLFFLDELCFSKFNLESFSQNKEIYAILIPVLYSPYFCYDILYSFLCETHLTWLWLAKENDLQL